MVAVTAIEALFGMIFLANCSVGRWADPVW